MFFVLDIKFSIYVWVFGLLLSVNIKSAVSEVSLPTTKLFFTIFLQGKHKSRSRHNYVGSTKFINPSPSQAKRLIPAAVLPFLDDPSVISQGIVYAGPIHRFTGKGSYMARDPQRIRKRFFWSEQLIICEIHTKMQNPSYKYFLRLQITTMWA